MSNLSVLRSKLVMPELSGSFLLTERLAGLHRNMDESRAVVVCAPAGYGKTSLAVSYFMHRTVPFKVCWYRLDPEDRNLSVFIAHLIEALFPDHVDNAIENTLENDADYPSGAQQVITALCRALWRHQNESGIRTFIVFDDFQNVAQVPEICGLIRYMLDNVPPTVSIFIMTRAAADVFTEKQKLEKKILKVSPSDLSFTNHETVDLMLDLGRKLPDPKLADVILKSTEGWIAGILILYQAIKNHELDTKALKLGKTIHEEALFRYLSTEVLKSVDGSTKNALARLALLQDFSEAEAAEILEIGEIKSIVEQCLDFGMFIQRIPGNPVVYRFHALFREFLLYYLRGAIPYDESLRIHLKAAGYYMRHRTYGRAAEHLVQCGNSESAMEMVASAGFNKFMIGETAQLKNWLDMLPDEMVRNNPVLLLFKVQLMPNSRQPEMVETLRKIMRLSLEEGNLVTYYDAASVLVYILMCSNDMQGLKEMTGGFFNEPRKASPVLENTLGILQMVRYIGENRLTDAQAQSESILYTLLPDDSKWLYLILSCIVYYCLGKLDNAERCMRTALALDSFKNIEPSRGFVLLFLSITQLLKNEREELESQISEVLSIGIKYDYEYLCAHAKRLEAFERYLSNDGESAQRLMNEASYLFQKISNKAMAAACRLLRRLWSIRENGFSSLDEAFGDLAIIRQSQPGLMVYESSLAAFGAISRESGDFERAEQALLEAIDRGLPQKGYQVVLGAYIHLAALYYARDDAKKGESFLKLAMDLGSAHSYFMVWDIHMPTLLEVTLRSICMDYCVGYARALLERFYGAQTAKYLIEKSKNLDQGEVAPFSRNFTSSYQRNGGSYYFVKASLLGNSEIAINGLSIPDSEWKTKKVKGMLDYLLLSSGSSVSKEVLAEMFWPDSDGRSAFASQRTALYNLRKVLARYGVEIEGEKALIEETLEGLRIRKDERLQIDVREFLELHEKAVRLEGEPSKNEERIKLLRRMAELYKGDLMAGTDYGDHVFHERERLRSLFIASCQKLGMLYVQCGAFNDAEEILRRAFVADPYNEDICLDLLKVYISAGRRSKAVKVFSNFKTRLYQELGIIADKKLSDAIGQRDRGTGGSTGSAG